MTYACKAGHSILQKLTITSKIISNLLHSLAKYSYFMYTRLSKSDLCIPKTRKYQDNDIYFAIIKSCDWTSLFLHFFLIL